MLGLPWLKLYRVEGSSMEPTLTPGSLLLGSGLITPKIGHVVILKRDPVSIKRIKDITDEGVWVEGDNLEASTDSRSYGFVTPRSIRAVVFMKLF